MKTKCNKLIALLLSLTMLMGVVMSTPMTAFAAGASSVKVTWSDGGLSVYDLSGSSISSGNTITDMDGLYAFYVKCTDGSEPKYEVSATKGGQDKTVKDAYYNITPSPGEEVPSQPSADNAYLLIFELTNPTGVLMLNGADITITLSQSTPPKNVTFTKDGSGFSVSRDGSALQNGTFPVESGTNFNFDVTVYTSQYNNGYRPLVYVNGAVTEANSGPESVSNGQKFSYNPQISEDTTIEVSLQQARYTVKNVSKATSGYTTNIPTQGASVAHGGSYSFIVTPNDGFDAPTVTYKMGESGDLTPTKTGTTYTIDNITGNVDITISAASEKQRTIHFVTGAGYHFTEEGGSGLSDSKGLGATQQQTFKVVVDATNGYEAKNMIVSVNGSPIRPAGNVYTVPASTADQTVTVTGVALKQYTVTLPASTADYTVTRQAASDTVTHGGSYSFQLTMAPAYSKEPTVTYSSGSSAAVSGANNIYTVTISDIKSDINDIQITTGAKKQCSITKLQDAANATIEIDDQKDSVDYGDSVSFTVKSNTGYKVTAVYYTIGNNTQPLTLRNGKYTIPAVTDTCEISVDTAPVTVTVTYYNWNPSGEQSQATYTYDPSKGDFKVPLATPRVAYYDPVEWKTGSENGDPANVEFKTTDTTVDVYGKWTINIPSLFQLYLRAETDRAGAAEGSTTLDLIVDWSPFDGALTLAEGQKAKITNAGILYAGSDFTVTEGTLETAIKEQLKQEPQEAHGNQFSQQGVQCDGKVYYYCYSNQTGTDSRDSTKTVRFRVKNGTNRYAIGWVAVQVGSETYIVFSELSDGTHSQHVFGAQG